jgi:hypothetical protein
VKSRLCSFALVVLSLCICNVFAGAAERPAAAHSNKSESSTSISSDDSAPPAASQFTIPGPLRSFERMAGISQKAAPEEILPLLSRNVFMQGYSGTSRPTEFLILLRRYVVQARELTELASRDGMVIRVSNCSDARPLLSILGYRTRGNCGEKGTSLQTDDPERAFLAIDSGFPLLELEQTLQGGKPFEYAYASTSVPVELTESDWTKASKKNFKENSKDLLDTILNSSAVARLYWAFSRLDPQTTQSLEQSVGISSLLPYGAVLDFYGKGLCISGGRVLVPGGATAEGAWKDLVGASPSNPAPFVLKLVSRDRGWLAAYFDVLSRVNGTQQAYFTDSHRLSFFYDGLRAPDPTVKATRGTFRPAPGLLLLATRLQLDSNGEPHVPGNLEAWKEILAQGHFANILRKSGKRTSALTSKDQLVQEMFAFSRADTDSGPLQIYIAISELDSRRSPEHRLTPQTVRLLARRYEDYSDQYRIFSEFPDLSNESITLFMDVVQGLSTVPDPARGNAFGIFQANVGIWQILARQGQISASAQDNSWQQVVKPFVPVRSSVQLYDAGRTSLGEIFRSATGKTKGSQDEIIEMLAGPRQTSPEGMKVHQELASRIRSVLDDQRLVSLDTLMTLGDALRAKAQGKPAEEYVVRLAGETREFEMPRPIFTASEHTEWAAGIYDNRHTEGQMRTDVAKVLKSSTASRGQIDETRTQLASFLRDTLVGLNYAYYEPPGAQALHNNPLFVRSHDFAGESVSGMKTLWQAPELLGQGSPAGGGAHFVGSLADLPYVLAQVEQDFLAPNNVQALIWKELTPELLTSAILPRWWDVSPIELHAVALYQRSGEELLAASAKDEALRSKVMAILSDRMLPQRTREVELALQADHAAELIPQIMPADTFHLVLEFQHRYPGQLGSWGTATAELRELCDQHPDQVDLTRLAHDFGTPHPSLAQNYGLELLNVSPMPPFSGTSSRFLAESWDSPNLYWARLADEAGYSPVMLNHIVPELTKLMVEKIFATDFEDWPALLRAMREAGEDFRKGKLTSTTRASAATP